MNVHPHLRGMGQSATLWINQKSSELQRQGREVFKFGLGQSPFPVPTRVVEALRASAAEKDYLPVEGLPALREAVAAYNHRTQHLESRGEDVLIGPGSKELMFLLQLVFEGDLVLPSPSWVSYQPQAHLVHKNVHWIETRQEDGWRLSPEALESFCREHKGPPLLLILNYPCNPTGCSYSSSQLERLAAVARKYGVLVLSDEIYGELHFEGKHVSLARFYPEGTIVSSGLSKWCGAGGWRVGTFSFARELHVLRDAVAAAASETFTSTSAPIQYASVAAFQGGEDIDQYLAGSRRVLKEVVGYTRQRLLDVGVRVPECDGAFYIFPDFGAHQELLAQRGIVTSDVLCATILEDTGVAFLPGTAFGRPESELTCRMSLVDFDGESALLVAASESGPSLGRALRDTCASRMVEATQRLVDWVGNLS